MSQLPPQARGVGDISPAPKGLPDDLGVKRIIRADGKRVLLFYNASAMASGYQQGWTSVIEEGFDWNHGLDGVRAAILADLT